MVPSLILLFYFSYTGSLKMFVHSLVSVTGSAYISWISCVWVCSWWIFLIDSGTWWHPGEKQTEQPASCKLSKTRDCCSAYELHGVSWSSVALLKGTSFELFVACHCGSSGYDILESLLLIFYGPLSNNFWSIYNERPVLSIITVQWT